MSKEELLTVKELMSSLKISEQMVYKLLRQGLPKVKIGSNNRFDYEEVLEWLKNKK